MSKMGLVLPVLAVALAACSGCISSHMTWVRGWEPDPPEELEYNCRFVSDQGPAAHAVVLLNSVSKPDDKAIEVSVFLEKGEQKPANWLLAKVNNIFSFFTVGVWPWVRSQEQDCAVELVAHGVKAKREFVLGHRVWSSFVLPIGILPCPGWSDWRSSPTFSLDFTLAPEQEKWESEIIAGYAEELLSDEEFLNRVKGKIPSSATPPKSAESPAPKTDSPAPKATK